MRTSFQTIFLGIVFCVLASFSSVRAQDKIQVGFLVHDLVTPRWSIDMENFSRKIKELGGEPVTRNAFGDAAAQIKQGKELIDQGVRVIVVVAQNGNALAELVDYANNKGATIIAYDRMIMNCALHYYISFNSVQVGEFMASYALSLKPKGNYVILNGPSGDNNASLVRQGVMNKLSSSIAKGDVKVLTEKEMESWNTLSAFVFMEDFLAGNKQQIDAIISANDDIAIGALDAIRIDRGTLPVITGQDASADACRNIMHGDQAMTVYKDITKLSNEAAVIAIKIAKGEKVNATATRNNGKINVPSILFEPVVIDKNNLRKLLVPGHVTEAELN